MGCEPSKELLDKRFIIIALLKFKYDLELAHDSFKRNHKLNNKSANPLPQRRIDYAEYLKSRYEKLVLYDLQDVYDSPVDDTFYKEDKGIRIVVTKGNIVVEQFVKYSPYYPNEKYEENQRIYCHPSLASYVQFC
jgi:hypothetical protein